MSSPTFSIVIPAYNEEKLIIRCLDSIAVAAAELGEPVEVIVANNNSTDRTAEIAASYGAKVVDVERRCISTVKNHGAAAATGKYLVFTDADNAMSDNMLVEIKKCLDSGRYIGGGVANVRTDRASLGITLTFLALAPFVPLTGVSLYIFYMRSETFWEVGGFDEGKRVMEDVDFAMKLKRHGKPRGLKFMNLRKSHVTMSARKFDAHGDWVMFRHPTWFIRACMHDREVVDWFWYRVNR